MVTKVTIAMNWAGACGGCDVSILDLEAQLLEVTTLGEIVFWPVALDTKRADLTGMSAGSIDLGIFNGVVRTSEQEEDARLLREKCKLLIAYGACASFGGIPGLANGFSREDVLQRVYTDTESTNNPERTFPQPCSGVQGQELTLPEFYPSVRALDQVVDVDFYVPGCPPPSSRVLDVVQLITTYHSGEALPGRGTTFGSSTALCQECSRRETRVKGSKIRTLHRVHEVVLDPELCFLEQGVICVGPATRGGCGETCIRANMPCRGCFGPVDSMVDQGADAISALASLLGDNDDDIPQQLVPKLARELKDPLGTFCRFSLPHSLLPQRIEDK